MKFTIPLCREDLQRFSNPQQIKNKIASMGDVGLLHNSKQCDYLPGFYIRRVTNKVSVLFFLKEGEPIIVRIRERSFLFKIITKRRNLGIGAKIQLLTNKV